MTVPAQMADFVNMSPGRRAKFYDKLVKPRLIELGIRICNASGMNDKVRHKSAFKALVQYYEELAGKGYWHPWLSEALGDFSPNGRIALGYYRTALEQVTILNGPRHTILQGMARRHFELGQFDDARSCLAESKLSAKESGDRDSLRKIRRLEVEWENNKDEFRASGPRRSNSRRSRVSRALKDS